MAASLDMVGKRFGALTVTSFKGKTRNSAGISLKIWNCQCDCGGTTELSTRHLTSGNTKSCGCRFLNKARTHGMHETRQYKCWSDMKSRCNNPEHKSYHHYGGRGIIYDPRWESFENFWEDMRATYEDNLTLERVGVNGNYEPGNCSWVEKIIQSHNRRKWAKNTSGVTGVRFTTDRSNTLYVAASAVFDGKSREKHFSVKKHGLLPAFKMAVVCREGMIAQLNSHGACYSDEHGK